MLYSRLLPLSAFAFASVASSALAQHPTSYHVAHHYVLGGVGRWDYVAFDTVGHRLFIARQDRVMVVDPQKGTLLGEIAGMNGAHGIAFDDALGHGFISSGRDSTVTMFDTKTLKVLSRTLVANDDDAILYDPSSKHVITFNGGTHSATVLDPASNATIGTIALGAGPEYGVADGTGKLYVNLTDVGEIAEIDSKAMRVTRRWSVAPCTHATGLAINRGTHRLFSGCRNKMLAISDAARGRLVTTLPIGSGVDANVVDPPLGNAFSSNGDGTLTIIHADGTGHFSVAENIRTMPGARTMAIDPQTHILYTVSAEFLNTQETDPHKRAMKPGTFTLLVIEPDQAVRHNVVRSH